MIWATFYLLHFPLSSFSQIHTYMYFYFLFAPLPSHLALYFLIFVVASLFFFFVRPSRFISIMWSGSTLLHSWSCPQPPHSVFLLLPHFLPPNTSTSLCCDSDFPFFLLVCFVIPSLFTLTPNVFALDVFVTWAMQSFVCSSLHFFRRLHNQKRCFVRFNIGPSSTFPLCFSLKKIIKCVD